MNRASLWRAARRRTPVWLRILVLTVALAVAYVLGPTLRGLGWPLASLVGFGVGVVISGAIAVVWSVRNPLPPERP